VILGTIVQAANLDHEIQYILTCFFIIFGAAITVHPLFFQKIIYIRQNAEPFETHSTMAQSTMDTRRTSSGSSDVEKDMFMHKVEELTDTVEILRKTLKKWKAKYRLAKNLNARYAEELGHRISVSVSGISYSGDAKAPSVSKSTSSSSSSVTELETDEDVSEVEFIGNVASEAKKGKKEKRVK